MTDTEDDIVDKATVIYRVLSKVSEGQEHGEVECPKCHNGIHFFYADGSGNISLRCKTNGCMTHIESSSVP